MMSDSLGHDHPYTLPEVERAHEFVARIVVQHGAVYLPLMDRMEREVVRASHHAQGLGRAQAVVDEYAKRRRDGERPR